MVLSSRDAGLPPRRSREAARQRRRSDRERALKLESLEPRLGLAAVASILDTTPPLVRSVSLPAAGTYGTGKPLTLTGRPTVPVTIGGVDREPAYGEGSKTSRLTFAVTLPRGVSVEQPIVRVTARNRRTLLT
jgi:hypothetical protein